jgi:hypothetical protein
MRTHTVTVTETASDSEMWQTCRDNEYTQELLKSRLLSRILNVIRHGVGHDTDRPASTQAR